MKEDDRCTCEYLSCLYQTYDSFLYYQMYYNHNIIILVSGENQSPPKNNNY